MSEDRPARRIEYRKLGELEPDPRNPRAHESAHLVRKSMGRFGFVEPIVVDGRTGYIVSGHGRVKTLEAMRRDGEAPPEGVRVNKKGAWLVPVVEGWASDSDTEAGAALIAMNRTTELGGWVDDELLELLADIEHAGDLGFDDDTLEEIRTAVAIAGHEEPELLADPDEAPAPPDEPRTKLGDVWQLGPHRVVCGDATDAAAYAAILGDKRADVMWTDPPYGVEYVGGDTTLSRDERREVGGHEIGGDATIDEAVAVLAEALPAAVSALRTGAPVYIAHADFHRVPVQTVIEAAGISYRQTLIWLKDRLVPGRSDYQWIHEPIAYGFTPSPGGQGRLGRGGKRWYGDDARRTVIEVPRPGVSKEHPTMKPVELVQAMLRNSAKPGDLVLDPFGGSGSTLIAADGLGMRARLIELDPRYVDVIVERWQRVTGGVAELVRGGNNA